MSREQAYDQLSEGAGMVVAAVEELKRLDTLHPSGGGGVNRNPHQAIRYFDHSGRGQTYMTLFPVWDGFVGAAHSDEAQSEDRPSFAAEPEILRPAGLDVVLYGCTLPDVPPLDPWPGIDLTLYGYPAGAKQVTWIEATIYGLRPIENRDSPELKSWMTVHDAHEDLAMGGVSGGPVGAQNINNPEKLAQARQSGTLAANGDILIGLTVNQNGRFDFKGSRRNSSDFVSLHDVWHAVKHGKVTEPRDYPTINT